MVWYRWKWWRLAIGCNRVRYEIDGDGTWIRLVGRLFVCLSDKG